MGFVVGNASEKQCREAVNVVKVHNLFSSIFKLLQVVAAVAAGSEEWGAGMLKLCSLLHAAWTQILSSYSHL